ncbi:MAG: Nif3-like dinuclear metal center hexameric protein [Firmicutes bacterium]|nr:Nif3-like dinuclear metal center hexameric protein [Bacillota bacterium]
MSMTMEQIGALLNEIAPLELQEQWDNSGVQIDVGRPYIQKVLVCLEITRDVVAEAIDHDVDLIVTHHPLLFRGVKKIDRSTPVGEYLLELIFTGISVYSSHTSFDTALGGNNDDLASRLGLRDVEDLEGVLGRTGYLPKPMALKALALQLDEALDHPGGIKVAGDPETVVEKVGLCTGAAGEFYREALAQGCQVYISGDVKHHEAQEARESGLCLIDAGHFGTEQIFVENMASQLREKCNGQLTVIESKVNVNPYDFVV